MIAVIYRPDGTILQTIAGSPTAAAKTSVALGAAWLEVAMPASGMDAADEFSRTHKVTNGQLVEIAP